MLNGPSKIETSGTPLLAHTLILYVYFSPLTWCLYSQTHTHTHIHMRARTHIHTHILFDWTPLSDVPTLDWLSYITYVTHAQTCGHSRADPHSHRQVSAPSHEREEENEDRARHREGCARDSAVRAQHIQHCGAPWPGTSWPWGRPLTGIPPGNIMSFAACL